jgi:hypothetical protein
MAKACGMLDRLVMAFRDPEYPDPISRYDQPPRRERVLGVNR